jgi:acyl-CoA thioester hydrolase
MHKLRFVESRTRVRYKDTDQMGIAHHSNYIVWFEVGRTDLCREARLTYREIEEKGFLLVVVEINCSYRTPYRYDDEVLIRTAIEEAGSRAMRFRYELMRGDGTDMRASGFSRHFWLDRETRRPVVAPQHLLEPFVPFLPARGQ